MNKKEILSQGLPKWPALIVWGKPVTEKQGWEILIKTCDLGYLSTNDSSFKKQIHGIIYDVDSGFEIDEEWDWNKLSHENGKVRLKTGNIYEGLAYLGNSQICSSFVGGAHGWCDWNGHIGANNYNIGKWPECDEVLNDWKLIAKAFPFLDLTCQLLSGETCEDDLSAVIQYRVKDGKVKVSKPNNVKIYPKDLDITHFMTEGWERGCSIEDFKKAYDYVVEFNS